MKYKNAELYNVAELVEGSGVDILGEQAREHLSGNPPERPYGDWGAAGNHGLWFTRIPDAVRRRLNGPAQLNAVQTTGSEIRFNLETGTEARIVLNGITRTSVVEIYAGPFFHDWRVVGLEDTEIVVAAPANLEELRLVARELGSPWDPDLTRVLLPWRPPCRLVALDGSFSPPRPDQTPTRRYLAYGSSITHGNTSVRPTAMYANRTAQLLDVDFVNLGFGGGAHLEEDIADHIAGRDDWDFASFELGINLIGRIDAAEFARRVNRFVDIIVAGQKERALVFVDLFTCKYDFGDGQMQAKVRDFRRIVRDKVAACGGRCNARRDDGGGGPDTGGTRNDGTRNDGTIYHLDGRELLNGPGCLTFDVVHPSPAGMEEIAGKLSGFLRPVVQRLVS